MSKQRPAGHQYILINNQETEVIVIIIKSPKATNPKDHDSKVIKSYRGTEGKDRGEREHDGNHTACDDVMPDFHRATLRSQTISYITREPTPTSLPWSTVISTLFLWMCLEWKGVGEARGGRKVKVLYTKRNDRDCLLL